MLVACCWLLVAGCLLLVTGCWLLVAGYLLLVACCLLLVAYCGWLSGAEARAEALACQPLAHPKCLNRHASHYSLLTAHFSLLTSHCSPKGYPPKRCFASSSILMVAVAPHLSAPASLTAIRSSNVLTPPAAFTFTSGAECFRISLRSGMVAPL